MCQADAVSNNIVKKSLKVTYMFKKQLKGGIGSALVCFLFGKVMRQSQTVSITHEN